MVKKGAFVSVSVALLVLIATSGVSSQTARADEQRLRRFELQVDELRKQLRIPGMSAAIVKDKELIWTKGFGYADLERKIPATPDTLFHLASVTKTFAAALIMQLVEQGKLDLDEPISRYSNDFKDDSVKIKHIITHTSSGTPGERFQYDGNRFDYLTAVIEKKTGKRFGELVVETFFEPLGMTSSVPYHNVVLDADKWTPSLGTDKIDRYKRNLEAFAQPYTYYGAGEIIDSGYPYPEFSGAAAGMLSTVRDMAKYDAAIDQHVFIRKETQEKAWTPFVSNAGKRLPYALGWFVMDHHGTRLIWHTGDWGQGFSAMLLKVPEKNVSLILLANSEVLVQHQYSIGDVMVDDAVRNAFACSFLDMWGIAFGCGKTSRTAVSKFIEQRRASAPKPKQVDPRILESYTGEYQFETLDKRIFIVTREGDKLFVQSAGRPKMEMFAESQTKFFSKIRPWKLVFTKSEGQPAELTIVQGTSSYRSRRVK